MEHKFKFGDQDVTYRSGTVRDREALKLMLRKLYATCGGYDNIPDVERELMWDYANFVAYTTPFSADWRRDPSETGERLYEGVTLFAETDSDTYDLFRAAQTAVEEPEKKS